MGSKIVFFSFAPKSHLGPAKSWPLNLNEVKALLELFKLLVNSGTDKFTKAIEAVTYILQDKQ
jgi:hypothetical protein